VNRPFGHILFAAVNVAQYVTVAVRTGGLLNLYTFGLTAPLLQSTVISVLYRIKPLHGTKTCFSLTIPDSYIGMFPNVLPGVFGKRKHLRDREEPIKQALKEEYIYILLFCFHYIYIYLSYRQQLYFSGSCMYDLKKHIFSQKLPPISKQVETRKHPPKKRLVFASG